jgi:phosphohistidine phosphatase
MQHGEAKSEAEDAERPLSDRGRDEVGRTARVLSRLGLGVAEIHHSGKLRARQTAEIVAAELRPSRGVREAPGLSPKDDPRAVASRIDGTQETWLIVGHLPHLSRLASLLVIGRDERPILAFRMGAPVCLVRDDSGWSVRWILTPEMAAALDAGSAPSA